jgi:alpha-glucosidase
MRTHIHRRSRGNEAQIFTSARSAVKARDSLRRLLHVSILCGLVALSAWLGVAQTANGAAGAVETTIASPDGDVRFVIKTESNQPLAYWVTLDGKPVIESSKLGFTVDGIAITERVTPGDVKRFRVRETYPWRGVHSLARNHCNGATLAFRHPASNTGYTIEVRVFNDGAAFRYVIPGDGLRVPDETSQFNVPAGSTVWFHGENGHYEDVHEKRDIAGMSAGQWAMPPVTFKLPRNAGYAAITEAALVNFSGMALQANGRGGFELGLAHKQPASYPYRLRYSTNDVQRLSQPAAIQGTITSPWRVVMVGRDLNAMVNSDIVHNLCPPADPEIFPQGINTPWVKPGRAVWKYLDGGESTVEGTKEFCRLAGELGFEYNVIEGYWSRWSEDEVKDMVRYARQRGVGLWVWKHSRSLHTPKAREEFFSALQRLGVVGAKIDFLDHEHKEVIDLYHALLRDAARHRIMINFHGSNKPTGEARTWPNELTRESIRGMESSRLADRATHDSTVPFTRYLAGHGDYTVMHFGARRANTTWAHQIATAVVFNQPLNTIAANPSSIVTNAAVELIKNIPAVWDETIVLPQSEIGELALFARRKGDVWFLAAVNGLTPRTLKVPLSFLPSGNLRALLVSDEETESAAVNVSERTLRRRDAVEIKLSAGGGFVARFGGGK